MIAEIDDQTGRFGGFTVLDGAALVAGAAVGLVHIRDAIPESLSPAGVAFFWLVLGWMSLTASGPFLYLSRRFGRPTPGYPRVGDLLWAMLGLPWLLTALIRTSFPPGGSPLAPLYSAGLAAGLAVASIVSLAVIWSTWVIVPPERADAVSAGPWTNRLGLALCVAWPIQWGLVLVVNG